ncbi:PTS system, cellobiose-specific IIC component [Granulicatella balaenopterae]|uniref:Permease IIC component n=1 Tax=Granulicatella balaenopterae TaxID=137733 RepID=A0A1H9N5C6_9LACT|nr:PTS sugar transporter subunit IIC [Granulicatella balaenopterae]SER31186.1 PTS system, cellobiose-specific IIC component [Granulicatella balaenopterae]
MKEKFQRIAGRIGSQRHLVALRDGMAQLMPLIIIGSVFMLVAAFPIEPLTKFLDNSGLAGYMWKATDATFGIIGIAVTFTVARNLALHYKVDGLSAGLLSLASYVLLTPTIASDAGNGFPVMYLGSRGLFLGIVVALVTAELFRYFVQKDIVIKMPDTVPPNVSRAFSAIIPGLFVILFWFILLVLVNSVGVENVHTLMEKFITQPLSGLTGSLGGVIVIVIIQSVLWMFGIHGAQVTAPFIEPILLTNSDANRVAMAAGQELPNIITFEFLYNYVFPGGAGCVFALALLLFFRSKSKENKSLGKLSMAPVSFQIAEPILFGFPTILNFKMVIPFILSPIVSAIICYFAMYTGLVPKPIGAVIPWTTPPVIAGFLACGGHISGAILNIVVIVVSTMIYYPFFKIDDNMKLAEEKGKEK